MVKWAIAMVYPANDNIFNGDNDGESIENYGKGWTMMINHDKPGGGFPLVLPSLAIQSQPGHTRAVAAAEGRVEGGQILWIDDPCIMDIVGWLKPCK